MISSITGHTEIKDSVCTFPDDCLELGKISWNNLPTAIFVHIRFDGGVCKDSINKKCDCIIFRFLEDEQKHTMYAIEVKNKNPNISEVRDQIQFCIDVMTRILPNPKTQFRIVPVVCAEAFPGFHYRALLSYRVKIFGNKFMIRKRLYGQDINQL